MSDDTGNWFGPFVNVWGVGSKVLVQGGLQVWLLCHEGQVRPGQACPQHIHHRPQLNQPSRASHGSVKTCLCKGRKWERREKIKRSKRKHQIQRRRRTYSTVKQTASHKDWGSWRANAGGPRRDDTSPASEQVLLMRLYGQQMSPLWSQYHSKLQFRANVFMTKWKEILPWVPGWLVCEIHMKQKKKQVLIF